MAPVLFLLVFGIIEFSLYLRDVTAVSSSVRVGVRIASAMPGAGKGECPSASPDLPVPPPCTPDNVPKFAQMAADAIQKAGTAMPPDSIEYIFVYKANAQGYPGGEGNTSMPATPAACAATANCVVYKWQKNSGNHTKGRFRYDQGTWNSKKVNACIVTKQPDGSTVYADSVGIYLKARHDFITGAFGDKATVGDRAVMTFEPLSATQCKPDTHE